MNPPKTLKDCTNPPSKGGLKIKDIRAIAKSLDISIYQKDGYTLKKKPQLCDEILEKVGRKNIKKPVKIKVKKIKADIPIKKRQVVKQQGCSVRNDCPKGYKRKELKSIAQECGIPIKRANNKLKSVAELCEDILSFVKKEELREEIEEEIKPLSPKIKKELKKELDFLEKAEVPFTSFQGTPVNTLMSYIHLLEENSDICVPFFELPDIDEDLNWIEFGLNWTCAFDGDGDGDGDGGKCDRLLIQPLGFDDKFNECIRKSNVRFILIPLGMSYTDNKQGKSEGHANVLIYDKERNEIERYEPHGAMVYGMDEWYDIFALDEELKKLFDNWDIKYISPLDFCPNLGLQAIEAREKEQGVDWERGDPGGFCAAWSIYWAALRLRNPDVPRDELLKLSIKHIKDFRKFIRSYAEFLIDKRDELFRDLPKGYIQFNPRFEINPLKLKEVRKIINNKIVNLLG